MSLLAAIIWTVLHFQITEEVTRDTESVRITEDYKSGSAGMRYNNVGRDAEGNIVDVRSDPGGGRKCRETAMT
ncbi:MAG: hypothetical protein ACLUGJ_09705 [Blautia wexlerae]